MNAPVKIATGLYEAIALAQSELTAPSKNREVSVKLNGGGSYKFKYATLDHLIEHVRGPLTRNGLWFVQMTEPGQMVTRIIHQSGEFVDCAVPMPNLPNKPQEAGSLLTYFRRYSLSVALGLASDEDDDANVAEGNGYEVRDKSPPRSTGGTVKAGDGGTLMNARKREPKHSALKQAVRGFVHELNGCGDADELNAFMATADALRIVREVSEKMPHWWDGNDWPEDEPRPEEFVPLCDRIDQRQRECAQATANYMTA